MNRRKTLAAVALLFAAPVGVSAQLLPLRGATSETAQAAVDLTPAGRALAAIDAAMAAAMDEFRALVKEAKTDEARDALYSTSYPDPAKHMPAYWAILEAWPQDPICPEVIWNIVRQTKDPEEQLRATRVMLSKHAEHDYVSRVLSFLPPTPNALALLHETSSSENARIAGLATFQAARLLRSQASLSERLPEMKVEDRARYVEHYGAETIAFLVKADASVLRSKSEALFEQISTTARFKNLEFRRGTLGQAADTELWEIRNLRIGLVAPEIAGVDVADVPFKLSDYRGQVVVLDFWGHW